MRLFQLLLTICFSVSLLSAQEFLNVLPTYSQADNYAYDIIQGPNKDYLIQSVYRPTVSTTYRNFKLDSTGQFLWGMEDARPFSIGYNVILDDNSFITMGHFGPSNLFESQYYAARFDADGQEIWFNTYGEVGSQQANSFQGYIEEQDGIILYGRGVNNAVNSRATQPYMIKFDLDGNLLWELKSQLSRSSSEGFQLVKKNTTGTYDFIARQNVGHEVWTIDSGGNILNRQPYFYPADLPVFPPFNIIIEPYEQVKRRLVRQDHEIRLSEVIWTYEEEDPITGDLKYYDESRWFISKVNYYDSSRVWVHEFDISIGQNNILELPNGDIGVINNRNIPNGSDFKITIFDQLTGAVIEDKGIILNAETGIPSHVFRRNGYYMCVGVSKNRPHRKLLFYKLNDNLEPYDEVETTVFNSNNIWIRKLRTATDGGYYGVATIYPRRFLNRGDILSFKADSNGVILSNAIQGSITGDMNNNCVLDSTDISLDKWIVKAEGAQTYFALTDNTGNYTLQVDTGDYAVSILPKNDYWYNCDTANLSLISPFDTSFATLQARAVSDCSFLEIDAGTAFLRRCFSTPVYIQYCNTGTLPETNSMIEVTIDQYLNIDSTSIPIVSQNGNQLTFDIGNIDVGECGKFSIYVTPDCDSTVIGQIHCIDAHITPDTLCSIPDSLWRGASVSVDGKCIGDSVEFKITNVGTATTAPDLSYIVIVDDLILRIGSFTLDAGDSVVFTEEATGVMRLEAEQEPYHPGNSRPTVTITGCGQDTIMGSGFRFISQFYQDDGDPFRHILCVPNRGSYDPNDKTGYPLGTGSENLIGAQDELDYLIRFQNTGTDTAFRVVIRDTLSEFLDPGSIRPGVSSHDYEFTMENNIITFTINPIYLPDSTTNFVESNGFVKFKINQIKGNLPGTKIRNRAGIYFDFNDPIITNTTLHTIRKPLRIGVSDLILCENETYDGTYYPNDTTINEFYYFSMWDSVAVVNITTKENHYDTLNLTLTPGEIYNEIPITNDTTYTEIFTAQNGCDSLVFINIKVDKTNALSGLQQSNWKIYPNPSVGKFWIESTGAFREDNYELVIYTTYGQQVWSAKMSEKVTTLDLTHLPKGTYLVQIKSRTNFTATKITIR